LSRNERFGTSGRPSLGPEAPLEGEQGPSQSQVEWKGRSLSLAVKEALEMLPEAEEEEEKEAKDE